MRRLARLLAVPVLALTVPATAQAAPGKYFAGETVDGPSADVQRLGDVDVARDGTGALAYVKRDAGVDHVFVSRLIEGTWQPPERIDGGLDAAGAQPVVAASGGGRLTVAFQNAGGVFAVVRPEAGGAWTAPALLAAGASNPAVDMSINGVAYATFTAPGASAADIRAARLERTGTAFAVLDAALDLDPARDAGVGAGRSRVAVAADGSAVATWGEGGRVIARRLFEFRLSAAPSDLTLDAFGDAPGGPADAPDVGIEDDSSYAWVVFRQSFGGLARNVGRRLVGSQFEAPEAVDGGEPAGAPRLDLGGRGDGFAASGGTTSNGAYTAALKDDRFGGGLLLGGGFSVAPFPVPAVAYNGDGAVAYQQGEPDGTRTLRLRPYDNDARSRVAALPGDAILLSDPALGPPDAARGLDAAANRAGDVSVAFVQGEGEGRRIVAAAFDRAPGAFGGYTTSGWRRFARPPLRWATSFELWGPLSYRVEIDGRAVATTGETNVTVPSVVRDGLHRWRVVATDRRGQTTVTPSRFLRVDATKPSVTFSARRRAGVVTVRARASDAAPGGARASGVEYVRIDWGDGSGRATVPGTRATASHRYGRKGRASIRVSATDDAGNAAVLTRSVRVG
jgi:hypothetical protein